MSFLAREDSKSVIPQFVCFLKDGVTEIVGFKRHPLITKEQWETVC